MAIKLNKTNEQEKNEVLLKKYLKKKVEPLKNKTNWHDIGHRSRIWKTHAPLLLQSKKNHTYRPICAPAKGGKR